MFLVILAVGLYIFSPPENDQWWPAILNSLDLGPLANI